jgi:hypothetical protein
VPSLGRVKRIKYALSVKQLWLFWPQWRWFTICKWEFLRLDEYPQWGSIPIYIKLYLFIDFFAQRRKKNLTTKAVHDFFELQTAHDWSILANRDQSSLVRILFPYPPHFCISQYLNFFFCQIRGKPVRYFFRDAVIRMPWTKFTSFLASHFSNSRFFENVFTTGRANHVALPTRNFNDLENKKKQIHRTGAFEANRNSMKTGSELQSSSHLAAPFSNKQNANFLSPTRKTANKSSWGGRKARFPSLRDVINSKANLIFSLGFISVNSNARTFRKTEKKLSFRRIRT